MLLLAGCASAPPPPLVTLQPDGDFWRATWQLAPARELRFDRLARERVARRQHLEVILAERVRPA